MMKMITGATTLNLEYLRWKSEIVLPDFSTPGCMTTVDIPLGRYNYRFRKLTYEEEFAITVKAGQDSRRAVLAAALTSVSGLELTQEKALVIVNEFGIPIVDRVWVLYRTGLPEERFFATRGLYRAPEPREIFARAMRAQEDRDHAADRAVAAMEARFGKQAVAEVADQERLLIRDAKDRGLLRKATPDWSGLNA